MKNPLIATTTVSLEIQNLGEFPTVSIR